MRSPSVQTEECNEKEDDDVRIVGSCFGRILEHVGDSGPAVELSVKGSEDEIVRNGTVEITGERHERDGIGRRCRQRRARVQLGPHGGRAGGYSGRHCGRR